MNRTTEEIAELVFQLGDREALAPRQLAQRPKLLATVDLEPSQLTPKVIQLAERLEGDFLRKMQRAAAKNNPWTALMKEVGEMVDHLIRWMGQDGWTPREMMLVLRSRGLPVPAAYARELWRQGRHNEGAIGNPSPERAQLLYDSLEQYELPNPENTSDAAGRGSETSLGYAET